MRTKGSVSPRWLVDFFADCSTYRLPFVLLCPDSTRRPSRVDRVLPGADPVGGGRCGGAFHPGAPQRRHQPRADGGLPHAAG